VWVKTLDAPPSAAGAMDAERVYVPLDGGGVRAFSRDSGELVWSEPADTRWPLVLGGDVLFTALPDEIRGRVPATGALRWSHRLGGEMSGPLAWLAGLILAPTKTGEVIALRDGDGSVAWRRALGAPSSHRAAWLAPNTAVLTLADARVVALDARTGDVIWEQSLPGTLSAPAIARDRVLVGSTNNFFYALDAESGDERWRWRTGGDVIGAAAAGDRVYFVSLDNVLRAVNRDNGNQLWKAAVPTRPSAPPIAFDDVVVLTGVAPRVDAYNGRTGAALGTFSAATDLEGAPLIDVAPKPYEVAIVALTRDGRLSGLRPTGLMFPDPPLVPLLKLPGRELPREPRPDAARLP
jgi:outer membrane protein assembly factor BamB